MWEKIIAVGQFVSPVFVFLGKTIFKSIIKVAKTWCLIAFFLVVAYGIYVITNKFFGLFNNESTITVDEISFSTKEITPVTEA